jgi:drug/metabolite transporter (DMT)-like permease
VAIARQPTGPWRVHLALGAAQTGFAFFPTLGKLALSTIPPLPLAALRVTAAAMMLELIRRLSRADALAPDDRKRVFLYGILGVSLNQVLFILGLSLTNAIHATILTATIPVFTLGVAVLMKRETLTLSGAAGVVLAGAGALVLINVQNFDWHSRYVRGDLLLLGNAVAYSLYLVLSRPILAHSRAMTIVSSVFLYGAPPILLFAAPALLQFAPSSVSPRSWASFAGVVVLCTVMPYALNSWALARTGASQVAVYVFLQPLIAAALAVVILKELLGARTVLAGVLILAGLAVSLARRKLPAEESA